MYSLVSAPVLCFDLTRLQGGPATAEVLLRGLCLTADDLPVLAAHLPDDGVRGPLWLDIDGAAARLPSVRRLGGAVRDAEQDNLAQVLDRIQRAPIGSVDGLLHCIRHDVLEWTWKGSGATATQ